MRLLALLSFSALAYSAITPLPIPRQSAQIFMTEGLFQGGSAVKANLEAIRFSPHPRQTERWVIDFADAKSQEVGQKAPLFQLRYVKGNSVGIPSELVQLAPPKFILNFQSIGQNKIDARSVARLLKKSQLVKDVVFYPAIEDGDMAVEVILKKDVLFEPHQPLQKAGRLVLDLRPATSR